MPVCPQDFFGFLKAAGSSGLFYHIHKRKRAGNLVRLTSAQGVQQSSHKVRWTNKLPPNRTVTRSCSSLYALLKYRVVGFREFY